MNEYIVKPGDTLSKLAIMLLGPGKTYQELLVYNPHILNPDVIEVGQKIFYPKSSQVSPTPTQTLKAGINPIYIVYGLAGALLIGSIVMLTRKS